MYVTLALLLLLVTGRSNAENIVSDEDRAEILRSSSYARAYAKFIMLFHPEILMSLQRKGRVPTLTSSRESEKRQQKEFIRNIKMANKHNKLYNEGLSSFTMTVNDFSVMTKEQKRQYLGYSPNVTELLGGAGNIGYTSNVGSAPEEWCWIKKGYVTPVKSQGACGSCWAFGLVVGLEYVYKKVTGNLVAISEQEVVDCTYPDGGRSGCTGASPHYFYRDRLLKEQHLTSSEEYPYMATDNTCNYKDHTNIIKNKLSFLEEERPRPNLDDMMSAVVNHGPVAVAYIVGEDFYQAAKGIYDGCKLDVTGIMPNHMSSLVGYGKDYWTLKNSWGANWGDKGYFKAAKRNTCRMLEWGSYVTFKVADGYIPENNDEGAEPRCKDKKKEDKDWHCEYYASRGDCQTKKDYMAQFCADSCGFCD